MDETTPRPRPAVGAAPPRTADARLVAVLLVALAASAVPGAVRAVRLAEAPRVAARPLRIDVNRAGTAELAALPGVGPALAARIAAVRAVAPFRGPEDLRRVPGIGPTLVARIAPHARFDVAE